MLKKNNKIIRFFVITAFVFAFLTFGATSASASSEMVSTEAELRMAISDPAIDTIVIPADITIYIESTIEIARPLTLTGGGTLAVRQDGVRVPAPVGPTHPAVGQLVAYLDTSAWPGQTGAMIRIVSGDVRVSNITLIGLATTSPSNSPAGFRHVSGIYVRNAGSLLVTLENLTINNMNHGYPDGWQDQMGGFGILTRGSNVLISNNEITRFNNIGISKVGGDARIESNTIIGMNDNNALRAKSGMQIWSAAGAATIVDNRIENLRFDGPEPADGILIIDGEVLVERNIFEYMDAAVLTTGAWGTPVVTMQYNIFNDVSARDTDMFVRVEGGGSGNVWGSAGTPANVTNYDAMWADRITFLFGGGIYNGALVSTPASGLGATAAARKIAQWENFDTYPLPETPNAPALHADVVTFYYPEGHMPRPIAPNAMLSLRLPHIYGTRNSDDRLRAMGGLIIWAGADGYIRGLLGEFPTATLAGYEIVGWRDWPYDATAPVAALPNPLLVAAPRTLVPIVEPREQATLWRESYLIGYPDGMIHPQDNITRAEMATIFFRLITDGTREEYWIQTNPFHDVILEYWFNNAISSTTNIGLFDGVGNSSFAPNQNITRGELAAVLVRFMGLDSIGPFSAGGDHFNDIANHWARDYINIAAREGWMQGDAGLGGAFHPDSALTRAETAAVINRLFGRLQETTADLLPNMIRWPDNMDTNAWYYFYMQSATNSYAFEWRTAVYEDWLAIRQARPWAVLERPDSRPGDILR